MGELSRIKSKRPWNKGKLTGQKPPLKLKEIWAIRIRLQISKRVRDLALFNLALDSKLRSCDLVKPGVCGKIVWESKRAENWSNKWIPKLKDDQQEVGGELAVLVSTAFPAGVEEPMVIQDGVWLVRPELVRPMAEALRTVLLESSRQKVIAAGKGEIMETIFNYITSPQFAQRVRAVIDAQEQMRDDLEKEKNAMQRLWKKREGQMERIGGNMLAMCGDLQGISGEALPELEGVAEMPLLEAVK